MQPLRAIPNGGIQRLQKKTSRSQRTAQVTWSVLWLKPKKAILRQFERTKEARKLYHIVGTQAMETFKSLL
jgi:hypothetical protein